MTSDDGVLVNFPLELKAWCKKHNLRLQHGDLGIPLDIRSGNDGWEREY